MEKKTILQRFKDWTRFIKGKPSGGKNGKASSGKLPKNRVAKAQGMEESAVAQAVSTALCTDDDGHTTSIDVRKLSAREETVARIREGFHDLSGILSSINTNIEGQTETSRRLDEKMDIFPDILAEARRGNDGQGSLVETLSQGLTDTELRQKEALKSLRAMPVALAAIQENEIAAYKLLAQIRDELKNRSTYEKEMTESFKTLDGTLKEMGTSASRQADQVEKLEKTQQTLVEDFNNTQQDAIESFQISQDQAVHAFRHSQQGLMESFHRSQHAQRKRLVLSLGALAGAFCVVLLAVTGIVFSAVTDLSDTNKAMARSAMGQNRALKEKVYKLEEVNQRTTLQLKAALEQKQAELALLMNASKSEIEKLGEEHASLLTGKNREIDELKDELAGLGNED